MTGRSLVILCLAITGGDGGRVSAQSAEPERLVFRSPDGRPLPYRLAKPDDYDPWQRYPLLLFLHGAGERGDDHEKQLKHALPVTLHSGAELGLSLAAYLHLAVSIPNLLLAIDNQTHNIAGDVVGDPISCSGGVMRPPTGPGLGATLDPEKVKHFRTDVIANPYLDPDRPDWFPMKPQY